jgi:alkanesulfonate monooxygenase SsuD/methylene tetrahydromethanopterin reductase-like flavin-dependent oxidoreductase (luciferase family)
MTKLSDPRPLEVGFGVWGMTAPYARPVALSRVYREAARHAQLADRLGFDSIWMGSTGFPTQGPARRC